MKYILIPILLISLNSFAQNSNSDSLLTYTRILKSDSLNASQVYDKAMIWCGERFVSSKDAIRVSDKSSGLISGKANMSFEYKVPKKKDSATSVVYSPFYFNWIMEVKENKLRIKVTEIEFIHLGGTVYEVKHPVRTVAKPPMDIMFMSSKKVQMEWDMARQYFVAKLNTLMNELETRLNVADTNW